MTLTGTLAKFVADMSNHGKITERYVVIQNEKTIGEYRNLEIAIVNSPEGAIIVRKRYIDKQEFLEEVIHNYPLVIICPHCSTATNIEITIDEYKAQMTGAHIQTALPNRPPEFRELFITGLCYSCQDEIF